MANKIKKSNNDKGFPIDERPIIFNLIGSHDVNFVGRYIEGDGIFMLSLNDMQTDFVLKEKVNEWWYINEHPIVVEEVLNQKSVIKIKYLLNCSEKYLVGVFLQVMNFIKFGIQLR